MKRRSRVPTVKSDPSLYVLADAIREVLGLSPLPKTAQKLNSKVDEETRFARTREWPGDRARTPVRGGIY